MRNRGSRSSATHVARIALALLASAAPLHADGIDAWVFVTHVFVDGSAFSLAAILLALMLVNYGTNAIVVAWPAVHSGAVARGTALRDLVGLTLLGQVADRIGAVFSLLLSIGLSYMLQGLYPAGEAGLGWVVLTMVAVSVLISGLVVGALAFHYVYRRWNVSRPLARRIALAAGVLTNPMLWALAVGIGVRSL